MDTATVRGTGSDLSRKCHWDIQDFFDRIEYWYNIGNETWIMHMPLATISRVLKLVSFFLLSSLYSSQSRLTLPWMFFQFGTLRKFPNFRYQRLDRSWRGLKEITLQLWHLAAETQPKSATCDPNQRLAPIIILHSISLIIFTNWSTATASVFFRNQCSHPIIPGTLSCKLISAHECFRRPAFDDSEVAQEIQNVSIVSPHHISIRKLGGMPVV